MTRSFFVLAAAGFLVACGSGSPADTEANLASIQDNVFGPTCANSGCHDASSKQGELDLSSADSSYAQLVGIAAVGDAANGMLRVVVGDAENSALVTRISGSDLGNRMPQGGAALPKAAIDAIKKWINDGAKK